MIAILDISRKLNASPSINLLTVVFANEQHQKATDYNTRHIAAKEGKYCPILFLIG
jgi:hypothetical protein